MTIRHQFEYDHSPEAVWEFLTKADLLAQWLMPNDFKPASGHKFNFLTKPMPKFGFDGIVHCEVIEIKPYTTLSYSWKGGNLDTVVTWTLAPKGKGTVLTLEHKGFKGIKNLFPYVMMSGGWAKIGKKVGKLLNAA